MIVDDYFLIEPDWLNYISLGRMWKTSMQVALSRGEKRARLLDYPFKRLQYTILPFTAAENNYVRRKLYRSNKKIFGVPIWCDRCSTTQDVNSGTGVTFTVDSNDYRQFEVGGLLIFFEDFENFEVKEINAIGSNQFTMDSAVVNAWPSGSFVYPILQGRLHRQLTLGQATTRGHEPIGLEVNEEFDEDITRTVYSGSSYSTYGSAKVFNTEPEWSQNPESMFELYPEITRYLAKSTDYTYSAEGQITSKNYYQIYSRANAYELVKFFDEQCGRWGNFWYPSWQDDVVLTSTFANTDTVLDVEDIEWNNYWRHNKTTGKYLYVLLPDGTEIIRQIISSPTATQLEVDSAMGTTITSLDGIICCFLYMGRFNGDELTIQWATETVCSAELEMSTLKDAITVSSTTTTTSSTT